MQRSLSRAALFTALAVAAVGCSSAPTYDVVPPSEAVDFDSYMTPEELALPREAGPPVSRDGGPRYPQQALNFNERGTVILVMTIGPDGRVIATRIVSETPPHFGFAVATEEWVRRWQFAPADAPRRVRVLRQDFKLEQ